MLGFHGLGLGSGDLGVGMPLPVVLVVARTALALPAVLGSDCSNSLKGGWCIGVFLFLRLPLLVFSSVGVPHYKYPRSLGSTFFAAQLRPDIRLSEEPEARVPGAKALSRDVEAFQGL